MTRQSLSHAVAACFLVAAMCAGASAGTVFFDDFNDGNAVDGMPVTWDPVVPQFPGSYDASSGDYLLTPPPGGATISFMAALARDILIPDVSIRAQVRKIQATPVDDEWVGIIARINPVNPSLAASAYSHYEAYLQRNGDLVILNRPGAGSSNIELGRTNVGLDVTTEDVLLQFDLFGDTLSARAWRPGESMPGSAQVEVTDSAYASGGIALTSTDGPNDSVGVFRYVHVADMPIPEPSSCVFAGLACAGLLSFVRRPRRCRYYPISPH
jgi:hypothetical protein